MLIENTNYPQKSRYPYNPHVGFEKTRCGFDCQTFAPVCEVPRLSRSWATQTYISWFVNQQLDRQSLFDAYDQARDACLKAAFEFNDVHFDGDGGVKKFVEGWVDKALMLERDGGNNLAGSGTFWQAENGRVVLVYNFKNAGKPKPEAEAAIVL